MTRLFNVEERLRHTVNNKSKPRHTDGFDLINVECQPMGGKGSIAVLAPNCTALFLRPLKLSYLAGVANVFMDLSVKWPV